MVADRNRLSRSYIAQGDILNDSRIHVHSFPDFLQKRVYHEVEWCVFHATFLTLCQWRSDCQSDDNIVGILRGTIGGDTISA